MFYNMDIFSLISFKICVDTSLCCCPFNYDLLDPPQHTSISSLTAIDGDELTCVTDANPRVVDFTWLTESGAELATGQTLTITEDMFNGELTIG